MELDCGKEKIRPDAGDAIHFDPAEPNRAQCAREEDGECLVIVIGKEHLKE